MTFERLYLLLLVVPPALWFVFNSHRSYGFNLFLINAFSAALLVSALYLPEFTPQQSRTAANILADALASLSVTDLRKHSTSSSALRRSAGG